MTQKLINLIMWTVIAICFIIGYISGDEADWFYVFALLLAVWASVFSDWLGEKKS